MLEQGAIFLPERQKDSRIHYEADLAPSCSPAALWTDLFAILCAASEIEAQISYEADLASSCSPAALWTEYFAAGCTAAEKQLDFLREGLAPSCSPAAQIPYGMHRTAEGAGENVTFPPHPPNTARHLPLKEKALLVRPICLHNSSLHNFVYATIKRIPYPSQYAVLCYIFIHFEPLLLCQINLHNLVDIITIFRTAVRSLP